MQDARMWWTGCGGAGAPGLLPGKRGQPGSGPLQRGGRAGVPGDCPRRGGTGWNGHAAGDECPGRAPDVYPLHALGQPGPLADDGVCGGIVLAAAASGRRPPSLPFDGPLFYVILPNSMVQMSVIQVLLLSVCAPLRPRVTTYHPPLR
jgi:hypothetical protein